jgi:nitrous oxide reductase accessory protein NosL
MLNLHKRSLATLLLAIMAMLMLAGCSSSDESSQSEDPSSSSGNSDCDKCGEIPGQSEEECLAVCD